MNEQAWKMLEEEKARRLPTPPVGWPVQWYQGGRKHLAVAAQVIAVEGPGRVALKLFPQNSFPKDQKGVYHVNHQIHDKDNNQTTAHCGSWDYCPGEEVPELHWELFDKDIERREAALLSHEEKVARDAAAFQAKQAEKKAKRKTLEPLPLPAEGF